MFAVRWMSGIALGSLAVLGVAVAPALGASDVPGAQIGTKGSAVYVRGIGSFTPASADPRLAAIFARGGLDTSGFRFTPSDGRRASNRAVTVAIRARSARGGAVVDRTTPLSASTVALTPIAYNLGVAVGWKRFAVSGDVSKVDLASLPGSRESADVGVSYTGKRISGRVKASADRPLGNGPKLIEDAPAYSIDVGGSYALTRRLDVTAGVRYKAERDRLVAQPTTDSFRARQPCGLYRDGLPLLTQGQAVDCSPSNEPEAFHALEARACHAAQRDGGNACHARDDCRAERPERASAGMRPRRGRLGTLGSSPRCAAAPGLPRGPNAPAAGWGSVLSRQRAPPQAAAVARSATPARRSLPAPPVQSRNAETPRPIRAASAPARPTTPRPSARRSSAIPSATLLAGCWGDEWPSASL